MAKAESDNALRGVLVIRSNQSVVALEIPSNLTEARCEGLLIGMGVPEQSRNW